jgi:hypothetical protein
MIPAVLLIPRLLVAQGLTTAAIQGVVVGADDGPIAGATVRVINSSDGRHWEIITPPSGRYVLEGVAVGGPYRIDVRAVGFTPEVRSGIVLALGQRVVADFALRPGVIELSPVTVTASAHPVLSPSRGGPAEVVAASTIAGLPNLGRDFVTLTIQSPQAAISPSGRFAQTEGITMGGQNRLLNNFQIDGGVSHDLYTGRWQPGLQTLPRPISLESIGEIQVLAAPFDVRHGGFAGGLVNAVTKSGTNTIHGSVFGFLADAALVGGNLTGNEVGPFTAGEYGGSVGGPLVRDRAHYFLSVDVYRRIIPDAGPLITDTAGGADTLNVGIRYTSALRFQDILRNTYGLDPGTLGPYEGRAPAADVLGKVTVQLGTNNHLELSHHYADGERRTFITRRKGTYFLSSVGQHQPATVNASRAIWTSLLGGRWSNELIASYLRMSEGCRPNVSYPLIRVSADRGRLTAGTAVTCPSSSARRALEVTDNLTVGLKAHVFTVGAHAEFLRFEDRQALGEAGLWDFRTLDSLAAGVASHYERTLPGSSGGRGIDFRAQHVSLYVQDRWQPKRALTVTAGLRLDVPLLPDVVPTNELLKAALSVDTGRLPSGSFLWSPRLGINYDAAGKGRTFLRGGIGLFSGRPAYAWLASAYWEDGVQQLFLSCDGSEVPDFDPVNQPGTCTSGEGITQRLTLFDPNVRFPQSLKVSLGVDHRLPGDWVATFDVLFTRTQHQLYFSDANLASPTAVAQGEGDRPLYGAISATGVARPTLRDPGFGQVVRASDRSGDHARSIAVQVRKRFADRAEVSALYAHSRARDRMSIVHSFARPNLETTPLDGTMENRRLRTSLFEIPHRVDVSAAMGFPYRIRFALRYVGSSGTPYTYVVRGDANADGIGTGTLLNDIVYVPRDSLDIRLANPADWGTLNRFIESEPCLRTQRGRVLARNSCRNPWFGTLNARLTKAFPTVSGQSVELTADVYNVLNLIKRKWGESRETTLEPGVPMLLLVGYDASAGRGIYRLQLPGLRQIQDLASRWQVELGVRYVF